MRTTAMFHHYRIKMPRLSHYVLRQLGGPIALFTFLLTGVVWLSQSLRLLDLVINRGQSAPTFVYLTILLLPTLLVIILPIAFFGGTLYGLHKLNADSELVVMSASGYSRSQMAIPVLAAAGVVMLLTWICSLYLMPLGQRTMKDKVYDIRADIGAAVLSEGQFNTPTDGLTVFIRELASDGRIRGILVHNNSNPHQPVTYLAESGMLVQSAAGARLIMKDGTIEQRTNAGSQLSVLKFQSYVFDLDQFSSPTRTTNRETSERYLSELFWPDPRTSNPKARGLYFAEAHNRIAQPLYCLAFALIALAAVSRGRRTRGGYALRLTGASIAAGVLRLIGYGMQGLASRNPIYALVLYAIPLAGTFFAAIELYGHEIGELFTPSARIQPEPAA